MGRDKTILWIFGAKQGTNSDFSPFLSFLVYYENSETGKMVYMYALCASCQHVQMLSN